MRISRHTCVNSTLALATTICLVFLPGLSVAQQSAGASDSSVSAPPPGNTKAITVGDLIKELKTDLLKAQKQAYERELELNKLKNQLQQSHPDTQEQNNVKSPWVDVNISGTPSDKNADQPAVTRPESFKTSIQYYRHQYQLKPGDKLAINFLGEDPIRNVNKESAYSDVESTFLQNISVLTDGTIVLPPFGVIHVAGKTLKEVNDELNSKIGDFYRFATVTVSLAEPAPDKILVLGKVKKQGVIQVPVGTTLSQIFKDVGGIDETADLQHIFIRKQEDGNVYMANMAALIHEGDIGQDVMLESGDVVVVPEGQSEIDYEEFKTTTFLPQEFEVNVLGAVHKPSTFKIKPGENVASALAKAGGPLEHALNNKITLLRPDKKNQTIKTMEFSFKDLRNPKRNAKINVALRPDDMIIVKDSKLKRAMHTFFTQSGVNALSFMLSQTMLYRYLLDRR